MSSDVEYIQRVRAISDPMEILREIIKACDSGMLGHDPYYAHLKKALIERARELSKEDLVTMEKVAVADLVHCDSWRCASCGYNNLVTDEGKPNYCSDCGKKAL